MDFEGVVEALLAGGADPNTPFDRGNTELHLAAQEGQPKLAKLLLKHGAHVNAQNDEKVTPLHSLAALGRIQDSHIEVAKLLLASGADLKAQDKEGRTPLHVAVGGGSPRLAELLLASGSDPNARGKNGETPLHVACWSRAYRLAELLLARGADAKARDDRGATALHRLVGTWEAPKEEDCRLAASLIAAGADPNLLDKDGWSPFELTLVCIERAPLAKTLLEKGADPNAMPRGDVAPVHRAALLGSADLVRALLDRGVQVNARDGKDQTPLHYAAGAGHLEVLDLLLARGAELAARDLRGRTALHWAAQGKQLDVVKRLLEKGADTNSLDRWDRTPLTYAFAGPPMPWEDRLNSDARFDSKGLEPVVRFLLERGADAKTKCRWDTPLHRAAERGQTALMALLLARGAEVDAFGGRESSEGMEIARTTIAPGATRPCAGPRSRGRRQPSSSSSRKAPIPTARVGSPRFSTPPGRGTRGSSKCSSRPAPRWMPRTTMAERLSTRPPSTAAPRWLTCCSPAAPRPTRVTARAPRRSTRPRLPSAGARPLSKPSSPRARMSMPSAGATTSRSILPATTANVRSWSSSSPAART